MPLLCLLFVVSRAFSAFAAVTFPKAKKDGMLRQETDPCGKKHGYSDGSGDSGGCGHDSGEPCVHFLCRLYLPCCRRWQDLLYYRHMAVKNFGGTTGDLSGWFTQSCELLTAAVVIIVCKCL